MYLKPYARNHVTSMTGLLLLIIFTPGARAFICVLYAATAAPKVNFLTLRLVYNP